MVEIVIGSIDRRTDGCSAEVQGEQLFSGAFDPADITLDHRCVSVEALAETHRNGVLKLGSSHL